MSADRVQLTDLLELIEAQIDLEHCREVDERYRAALSCEEVDRPPLVCQRESGTRWQLPEPWNRFRHYTYREAFDDPCAMMQKMLLDRVVPGLILNDDNPLAIRNDHGTIQIASLIGGAWEMHGDNYPWVKSLGSTDAIRELVEADRAIDWDGGVLPQSFRTLEFYNEMLSQYPRCKVAIQVSLPDLQGPVDTADILWGSEIFLMMLQEPELVMALMDKIVRTMLAVAERYRGLAQDHLDPVANTQHGYNIPGRFMIRDDSAIMVSPDTYRDVIAPFDARLLEDVGSGTIHFCGNGQHLVEAMLEIPGLRGLDFGQAELMDIKLIYDLARPQGVALTRLIPSRAALVSGEAAREFPTGCAFVYTTGDIEDAAEVVRMYATEKG